MLQPVSCTDLSHSHVVADLTGPRAVIARYRLKAYATLAAGTI